MRKFQTEIMRSVMNGGGISANFVFLQIHCISSTTEIILNNSQEWWSMETDMNKVGR